MTDNVTESSGNVFADLDVPNPEEQLAKAALAAEISKEIVARKLTQKVAGDIMGIDQPKVSALMRGQLSGFTMDRLVSLLNTLDLDVDITVNPKPASRSRARTKVHV